MSTRMSKYKDDISTQSRVSRNADLYKEINNTELESFNVRSNSTVIGTQNQDIDIEKLKKILDTRYNSNIPKRKSINLETNYEEESIIDESPTKEYDLNAILEQAKEEKEESYEEARVKKLRDTQFDILKNLNIEEKKVEIPRRDDDEDGEIEEPESKTTSEKELEELINTITLNETKVKEQLALEEESDDFSSADPLDLFSDLKGSENTEVIEGLKEEIEKIEKTSKVVVNNTPIDNSFYTTTSLFKKKDFNNSDFDEYKLNLWIKILIAAIIIVFVIGLIIFLKSIISG